MLEVAILNLSVCILIREKKKEDVRPNPSNLPTHLPRQNKNIHQLNNQSVNTNLHVPISWSPNKNPITIQIPSLQPLSINLLTSIYDSQPAYQHTDHLLTN